MEQRIFLFRTRFAPFFQQPIVVTTRVIVSLCRSDLFLFSRLQFRFGVENTIFRLDNIICGDDNVCLSKFSGIWMS